MSSQMYNTIEIEEMLHEAKQEILESLRNPCEHGYQHRIQCPMCQEKILKLVRDN